MKLKFEDGVEGVIDLSRLVGRGVFEAWRDEALFRAVRVEQGDLVWGSDIDLSGDSLYLEVTGKRPEELFPALQRTIHA